MVNTVDTIGAAGAPSDVAARPAVVRSKQPDIAAAVQAASAKSDKAEIAAQPISPRITQDALAGAIVTQYSDLHGDVTQQVPSQAALAYLRAGLTAQGTPKSDDDAHQG